MRVALIPTGVMELEGLAKSLQACFGDAHQFVAVPSTRAAPGVAARPFAGFTSDGVKPGHAMIAESPVRLLAAELAQQVYPRTRRGRTEDAADLAVVIDDLELENVGAEAAVVGTFRDAVLRHVEEAGAATDRAELRRCLREHGSFHIASVMTESWFFADPKSMALSGVTTTRPARMVTGTDPEAFLTGDPLYLADTGEGCTELIAEVRRRGKLAQYKRAPWVTPNDPRFPHRVREKHPKHYLQWLCHDPRHKRCTAWHEVKVGGSALSQLDWVSVLANANHCRFARSFIEDVAAALGVAVPGAPGGDCEPLTQLRMPGPTHMVLRNL